MSSAQVQQQTAQAGPQTEKEHQHPGPEALQQLEEEEHCEPALQVQRQACASKESAVMNEPQASSPPNECGMREAQQPAAENQSTRSTDQEASAPDSQGASKSPESAQLRARRLAVEAAEAQEAAQQAAKLAVEKQLQALEASKEAMDEIEAEHAAAKAAAVHEVEEIAERACKQQKMCAESAQDTLRDLVQTTAEESLRQAVKEKGTAPNQSSQSADADGARDDVLRSVPRQLAMEATETVQQKIEATVDKTVAEIYTEKHDPEVSQNAEHVKNPAPGSEVPSGPETPTRPGPHMVAQAPEGVPIQPSAAVNGIQVHPLDPNVFTQNPYVNSTVLPVNVGLGKAAEVDTYRTVPENQPTDQGPAPMQVG